VLRFYETYGGSQYITEIKRLGFHASSSFTSSKA
jgi:hypothetical protein